MAKTSYSAPSAQNMIKIIELLCESTEPMGARAICNATGLNTNMVFRLLKTLHEAGWISSVDEDSKYMMSLRPYHFISKPVKRMSLSKAAHLPLKDLWQETGESCYLGMIEGTQTFFLEHLDSVQDVRITARPGGRFLMHCAAPGKVLLAFSSKDFVSKVIKEHGLPKLSDNTISSRKALDKELKKIREQGFAIDNEEYTKGLFCFAAPIFNCHSGLEGTIGLSVLDLHYSLEEMQEQLGPKVIQAAQKISTTLGHVQE